MTTAATLRRLYTSDSVTTASPAQLVVMLYDRLVKDLNVALIGLERRDIEGTHMALVHAQEIVSELSASLDTSAWPGGESLKALYDFVKPGGTSPGFDRTNGGLIVFPGGVPVKDAEGRLIGAVGVSGGMVDQDFEVATAAVAALN